MLSRLARVDGNNLINYSQGKYASIFAHGTLIDCKSTHRTGLAVGRRSYRWHDKFRARLAVIGDLHRSGLQRVSIK